VAVQSTLKVRVGEGEPHTSHSDVCSIVQYTVRNRGWRNQRNIQTDKKTVFTGREEGGKLYTNRSLMPNIIQFTVFYIEVEEYTNRQFV
jgi:hypothetical protein